MQLMKLALPLLIVVTVVDVVVVEVREEYR